MFSIRSELVRRYPFCKFLVAHAKCDETFDHALSSIPYHGGNVIHGINLIMMCCRFICSRGQFYRIIAVRVFDMNSLRFLLAIIQPRIVLGKLIISVTFICCVALRKPPPKVSALPLIHHTFTKKEKKKRLSQDNGRYILIAKRHVEQPYAGRFSTSVPGGEFFTPKFPIFAISTLFFHS